ncbi:TIGR01459 family HAD-type hydrolase [Hyphomicrobium sp.]|uniref:TIGR01459 family HAD-type hydrolase n=1 Tax=Hyphomicrobium sp. TaxID=82 RepID=UPI002E366985|nr:TIGR01459 family HAD-type hydrolase [Hyphomicrobium sp.]HEX2840437.1 TIGR01459 family HAD-type hydrolase [Hyphomicrobium sp.]
MTPGPKGGTSAPPILTNAAPLLGRYTVLFCDVWGVIHDGVRAYPAATDALLRFRSRGGVVILVTNAPVPIHRVEAMLEARHVPPEAYDGIVSSGEIALAHLRKEKYANVYFIGPRQRDAAFFEKAGAMDVSLEKAEAVVCTGLNDDVNETVESYRDVLSQARARDLPFVCANPDLVVDVGGRLFLCAGALADAYAHMGGEVFWAGKPHASAYDAARAMAEGIRGAKIDTSEILVVGDAVRTDLAGARGAGLDALFIAGGIHRHETMTGHALAPEKLGTLFPGDGPPAIAAMAALAW